MRRAWPERQGEAPVIAEEHVRRLPAHIAGEAPGPGAEEAHRLGFLNGLVPQEDLEQVTMDMAGKIAAGPPIAILLSELLLYQCLEFDLEAAMKMAAAAETITLTSRDHGEGTRAIRKIRNPVYEGR